ncbi:hypothetical protein [Mucilaginibacter sp.]
MLEQYYRINQAVGVSIQIGSGADLKIHACGLSVEKNKLTFDQKITGIAGIEGLQKHFAVKLVTLNLSGKGILQKQTELIQTVDQHNFSSIFPNANIDDFYVQNFQSGKHSFISIIRKREADRWLQALKENGYMPLSLSLGPFPVQNIIPQLNSYDGRFVFNGNTIEQNEDGDWLSWNYDGQVRAPFPIKVESEPIDEQLVLAYAAAFQLILSDKIESVVADVPELQQVWDEVITGKRLRVYGGLILVLFFVLLLINFVVFSGLKQSNDQLTAQVSRTVQSSVDLQSVNEQASQKETLLGLLGWDGGMNKTALVDQVASLMPGEITLDEITVNPVDIAKSRVQKILSFSNRQIETRGFAEHIIPVNEWIARIKTKPWVKDIQLANYTFNNEKNTGEFLITIKY